VQLLIVLNFGASFGTLVLIWLVQILIYPSFEFLDRHRIQEAHRRHTQNITWVVAPLVFFEVLVAALLVRQSSELLTLVNAALAGLAFATTILYYSPLHARFLKSSDLALLSKLRNTNWLRTVLWSLKFVTALALLLLSLGDL